MFSARGWGVDSWAQYYLYACVIKLDNADHIKVPGIVSTNISPRDDEKWSYHCALIHKLLHCL